MLGAFLPGDKGACKHKNITLKQTTKRPGSLFDLGGNAFWLLSSCVCLRRPTEAPRAQTLGLQQVSEWADSQTQDPQITCVDCIFMSIKTTDNKPVRLRCDDVQGDGFTNNERCM